MKFKKLIEKRNELVKQMNDLVEKADTETRALNEEEIKEFDKLNEEVTAIDKTLKLSQEERSMWNVVDDTDDAHKEVKKDELEKRAFESFLRKGTMEYKDFETRSEMNFTKGDNGAVIPQSISGKIVETIKNISPILALSEFYDVKGKLIFPVYDEGESRIKCTYADEFTALKASAAKFTSKALEGHTAGALAKISKSLVNNSEFDIVNYVITKVAEESALFLERELLNGTEGKMEGVLMIGDDRVIKAPSGIAITADDLIDTQMLVPQVKRANGVWIMHPETFKAISKLKDKDGNYLLNKDIKDTMQYRLLGNPVFESDAMPTLQAGKAVAVFGDMKGLATKIVKDTIEIEVLQEKYADEHAIGVINWLEADSKIINPQYFGVLKAGA